MDAAMALLHHLAAYGRGNLTGVQAAQRDWSPFVAHFTTSSAMSDLRAAVRQHKTAQDIEGLFEIADARSWDTIGKILESNHLRISSPSEKDALPPCVSLSECTLPGLMSHCERYGRFGFVFSKRSIFDAGGRPCLYVGRDEYRVLALQGRNKTVDSPEGRLYALSNVYEPPRAGAKLQDYTHEREWRIFQQIDLSVTKVVAMLAPAKYTGKLSKRIEDVPIVPIDTLFQWGA
jgi:hypothetical protein